MNQHSKSGLFLLELMVVIGLFAFCAAVCLQLFAYANATAQQAQALSQATLMARSGAACYQVSDGQEDTMAAILGGTVTQEGIVVGYDQDWQPTDQTPTYTLSVHQQDGVAIIVVWQQDVALYTLEASALKGGGG